MPRHFVPRNGNLLLALPCFNSQYSRLSTSASQLASIILVELPTVRQLATELRVNFNTVARAYRHLDEAGLISTQHGRGTYVWELPSEEASHQLRRQ